MDAIRKELPNEPGRTYSLVELFEKIATEEDADVLIDSLNASNCKDSILIEMVANVLLERGFEQQFNKLLDFNKNKIMLVHFSFYCLQKCIQNPDQGDYLNQAEESYRKALTLDYKFFLVWLVRCFVEIYKGNFTGARSSYETALSSFNQTDDAESSELKKLYRFNPLIKLASGFLKYANEDYQSAYTDFLEVAKVSIHSIPMIRGAIGLCLEKQEKRREAFAAYRSCLSHIILSQIREKGLQIENPESKTHIELLDYAMENNIIVSNTNVLLHLAQIDAANRKKYIDAAKKADPDNISIQLYWTHLRAKLGGKSKKIIKFLFGEQKKNKETGQKEFIQGFISKIPTSMPGLRAECYYQIARANHESGKASLQKVLDIYQKVIENNPNHLPARFAISHLKYCLGNVDDAIDNLKDFMKDLHSNYEASMIMGMCYATKYKNSGNIQFANDAKTNLAEAIRLLTLPNKDNEGQDQQPVNEELYKLYSTLGWLYLKTFEYNNAKHAFLQSIDLIEKQGQESENDSLQQNLTFLAICQFQLEEFNEALNTFQKVENQSSPIIIFNIARCYEELGQTEKAIQIYTDLTNSHPSFPEPYIRLGVISMNETTDVKINQDKAKEYFKTVIQECKSQTVRAQLYLAKIYNNEGNYKLSTEITDKIMQTKPPVDGSLTATVLYANAFLLHSQTKESPQEKEKNFTRARTFFYAALRQNHSCISAASGLALIWLLSGEDVKAKNWLRIVKENQPKLALPAECLGQAYLKSGPEGANQAAKEFDECNTIHYDRTSTMLYQYCYEAFKTNGNPEDMLTAAEYMIQLEPDRNVFWYMLGSALFHVVRTKLSRANPNLNSYRTSDFKTFIAQAERCIELFEAFGGPRAESKINDLREKVIPNAQKRLQLAEKAAREEQSKYASYVANPSITQDDNIRGH